jgi:hypothetical protein
VSFSLAFARALGSRDAYKINISASSKSLFAISQTLLLKLVDENADASRLSGLERQLTSGSFGI